MVIVRLQGGLGNQLFQYAAARRLSISNSTTVKLDLSLLLNKSAGTTQRDYGLNDFNLDAEIIEKPLGLYKFLTRKKKTFLDPLISAYFSLCYGKNCVYKEKNFLFCSDLIKIKGTVYLEGFFQSYKYFEDTWDQIKTELTFKAENINNRVNSYTSRIKECGQKSVAVHIRRGDYMLNPETFTYHGICGNDYYIRGINCINSRLGECVFFVFSDDESWVSENCPKLFGCNFIHVKGNTATEDLMIMSQCDHFIIANSTFSWWGSYLGKNENKIIIAPKNWFNKAEHNTGDLIPQSWTLL